MQSKHKQTNCKHSRRKSYGSQAHSFLSRYHFTKSKNYLKRWYRIRYWIPMFFGTLCTITFHKKIWDLQIGVMPFPPSMNHQLFCLTHINRISFKLFYTNENKFQEILTWLWRNCGTEKEMKCAKQSCKKQNNAILREMFVWICNKSQIG